MFTTLISFLLNQGKSNNELVQRNTNCVDLAELIIEKRNNNLSKEGYPNDFSESGEGTSMPSQVREINVNMAGSHNK